MKEKEEQRQTVVLGGGGEKSRIGYIVWLALHRQMTLGKMLQGENKKYDKVHPLP